MTGQQSGLLVLSLVVMLSAPGISGAEITFRPTPIGETSNELPAPISEFFDSFKGISNTINGEVGRYVNISPIESPISVTKINQLNLTQWLRGISQNPIVNGVYSIVVKILRAIGNLAIWILGSAGDLIKQGLAFLR